MPRLWAMASRAYVLSAIRDFQVRSAVVPAEFFNEERLEINVL